MSELFAQTQFCAEVDDGLLGHNGPARQVAESWRAGRMHHAWLLIGIEGIGKANFAMKMAAFVLSGGKGEPDRPLADDRQVQHALAETHPDLLMLRRAVDEKTGALKQGIVVDDALRVGTFLHKTSSHGGWRVVVIDEAHTLNRNAQNAILKILEEPPSRAMIIMTATTVGAMLPTIRSRCRVMSFASLADDVMLKLLHRHVADLGNDNALKLLPLAGGSIGRALRILKTESLEIYNEIVAVFDGLPCLDIARLHKLADKIAPKGEAEAFDVATGLFMERLRSRVVDAVKSGAAANEVHRKLQQWDSMRGTLNMSDYANLDRKLALISAFGNLKGR